MVHWASVLQDSKAGTLDWIDRNETLIVGSHDELNRRVQQGLWKTMTRDKNIAWNRLHIFKIF